MKAKGKIKECFERRRPILFYQTNKQSKKQYNICTNKKDNYFFKQRKGYFFIAYVVCPTVRVEKYTEIDMIMIQLCGQRQGFTIFSI